MVVKLLEDVEAHGHDVGAGERGLEDVQGVAGGSSNDLSLEPVVGVNRLDLADQVHAVMADGIEAADEGANVSGADLGRQQSLQGGEGDGDVRLVAFGSEDFDSLNPLFNDRHLDNDVFVDFGQFNAFLHDAFGVQGNSFQADGSVHDIADFAIDFARSAAGLGNVGRVGGDAVNDAPAPGFADLGNFGSIKEQFHFISRTMFRLKRAQGSAGSAGVWFPFVDSEGGSADGAVESSQSGINHSRRARAAGESLEVLLQALEERVAEEGQHAGQDNLLGVEGAIQLVEGQSQGARDPVQN